MNTMNESDLKESFGTLSETINGLNIYTSGKTIMIKGLLNDTTVATVYDIQGRLVSSLVLNGNTNRNELNLSNVDSGLYIVKITNKTWTKAALKDYKLFL